jgi:hypothetical protein
VLVKPCIASLHMSWPWSAVIALEFSGGRILFLFAGLIT